MFIAFVAAFPNGVGLNFHSSYDELCITNKTFERIRNPDCVDILQAHNFHA